MNNFIYVRETSTILLCKSLLMLQFCDICNGYGYQISIRLHFDLSVISHCTEGPRSHR